MTRELRTSPPILALHRTLACAAALAATLVARAALAQGGPSATPPPPASAAGPAAPAGDAKAKLGALLAEARQAAAAKEWKKVQPLAEEAAKLDPQDATAQALLGLSLHAQRRWGAALPALEKALAGGVTGGGVARAAGECAEKRKDRARAAKWSLAAAREEKDQALALKAARAADAPALALEAYELAQSLGKLPPAELAGWAAAAEGAGRLAGAAALWDQAAAANPKDDKAPLAAARARIALKDWPAAEERLKRLQAARPDDPAVLLLAAQLAAGKGDAAGERKLLEALVEKQPRYAPAQLRLGKLQLAAGDLPGARAHLAAATAAAPDDAEGHKLSSVAALQAGDPAAALASAKAAVKLAPKDAGANLALGRAAYAGGDCGAALPALIAGRSAAGADGLADLGDCQLKARALDKARGALAEALAKDPQGARASELLGDVAMAERKFPEAVKRYAAAAPAHAKDVPFLVKQAGAAGAAGDREAALAALDGVLAVDPVNPPAALAKAKLLRDGGAPADAAALLAKVAGAHPKDAPVQSALAGARLDAGDAAGAQSAAEAALALDAKDQPAHDVLGRALYAAGRRDAARPHLEAACAQPAREKGKAAPPEAASGDALAALADLELAAGKKDTARALVGRARAAGAKRAPVVAARLQAREGDLAGAERTITGYLAQNADDGEALSAGAEIAYERGQYPQARERFEKAVARLPKGALTPAAQGRLCDVRVRDAAYAEAKEACEGALKGGADGAPVHASYGLALYRSGDKKAGKAELDAAARKGAKEPAVHGALGAIALEEGREGDALAEYNQVLAQESNNAEANAATGRILEKRGQHKDAAARLSRSFAANPDDALLGADLAKAQLGAGQLAAAQKTMGQIPPGALPPEVFHGLRGRVENKLGNYKRADEEYAKALEKAPEDPELRKLRGQNFLKMPNYDRAIPELEKAQAIDPKNLEVAQELTRLYSETGQTEKVARALGAAQALEKEKVAERRKELRSEEVKRVSFQDNLAAKGGEPALASTLSERVAADLSRSPYVELVDLREQMALDRQREAIERDEKLSQEEKEAAIARLPHTALDRERDRILSSQLSREEKLAAIEALKGKEKVAQWALSGDYRVEGDQLFVNLKAQRLVNPVTKSSLEGGPKAQYAQVEKRAVIGLLKNLDVPISPEEEAALGRTEGLPNLDSAVLTQQADELVKKGDVESLRKATELYKRARDADQGNAQALLGLDRSLAEIAEKNRLMVLDPRPIGEVPESLQDMIKLTLQSKLSGVRGVRVVEGLKKNAQGEEIPENESVAKELDRLAREPESFDPSSYDVAKIGQALGANVLVKTEVVRSGDELVLNARLHEIKDGRLTVGYGTQRSGKLADQQKIQADVSRDLAQYLRGEPSDEEKAALAAVKDQDDYKKQMDELARLRAEEKARKEALARAGTAKPTEARIAPEPPKPVEERKPAVVELGPVPAPKGEEDRTFNVFMAAARLSSFSYRDDKNTSVGLVLSHVAKRWGHNRLSVLLDFESTRVLGSRDAGATRAAFYGAGADYTVPIAIQGTGLFLGAEALLGLGQGQAPLATGIASGLALTLAPHAGVGLAYKGVGITADIGYRIPFYLSGGAKDGLGLGGFFLQAGLRRETSADEPARKAALTVAYTAHLLVPNKAELAGYKTVGFVGGGALLQHTVTLLSQGRATRTGVWLSYGSAAGSSGIADDKLTRVEASWAFLLNAFDTEDLLNPYVGFRVGGLGAKASGLGGEYADYKWGVLGAAMAGLDLQLFRAFVVSVGASYDASTAKGGDYDGYAVDATATFRF